MTGLASIIASHFFKKPRNRKMKFITYNTAKKAIFHLTRRCILEKSQRLWEKIGWVENCVINLGKLINAPLSTLEIWHENRDGWQGKIRASCIINSDNNIWPHFVGFPPRPCLQHVKTVCHVERFMLNSSQVAVVEGKCIFSFFTCGREDQERLGERRICYQSR